MTPAEREVMDRACEVVRRAMESGPLVPLFSVPEGYTLRCGPADEPMLRERFKPETPIEVDQRLPPGKIYLLVTPAPFANHIAVTIGFVNPPGEA